MPKSERAGSSSDRSKMPPVNIPAAFYAKPEAVSQFALMYALWRIFSGVTNGIVG